MFVRTFCFFSFRRFLSSRSLSFRISSTSRSRIFHTRILTRLRFLFYLIFFFSLLISPFLSHTRTLSLSVSCLTQLMQNVPTQSDECVCVYIFPVILFKSILTIAFCSTLSSFFFHHSSSKFARFLFFFLNPCTC